MHFGRSTDLRSRFPSGTPHSLATDANCRQQSLQLDIMPSIVVSLSRFDMHELAFYGASVIISALVIALLTATAAVLYQYFTFNSVPPGTRPLPSPKGRLPVVGHRHLIHPVRPFGMLLLTLGENPRTFYWMGKGVG